MPEAEDSIVEISEMEDNIEEVPQDEDSGEEPTAEEKFEALPAEAEYEICEVEEPVDVKPKRGKKKKEPVEDEN